jgi:nitrogen fixation/metabolism regulation signal transduction histidine kinase
VSEDETERNFQGSGLGLAIVKTIINKHGFTIELLDDEVYTKKFVITI